MGRLRDLQPPTREQLHEVIRYEHDRVGDLVHADVKKLGRIPTGGGRQMHCVGTGTGAGTGTGTGKVGCTYLHSALADHSGLACTEALDDEKAVTAVLWAVRSNVARARLCLLRGPHATLDHWPGQDAGTCLSGIEGN
ncbi:hypothetical protein [Streptomyces sp. CoH27]|uniref:hypothetical protein n=1 Tax=Streptomyces sp. CoH27 TaxID=2875763 RepID=UPI001CD61EC4|nr:hypothetical protein [Streptomyces sp. CoH27]